ncbi:MAG: 1,4-dihydroxy-2-naphthoate octaprenyltransferase [Deltaproteobacteria bacterium]|jgi:1,4-dihydroxy-2-naphthoate octaprenyltransferase|nr:1,4-dihydroxy-2-naphthoate octaprenyltransferase [Deltaproteobacteria bacterium]
MNIYRNWLLASRPWSFAMTAISVSVGSALGAIDGSFSWALYLVTLLGTILLHAATNLINDYYDVKSGVDTPEVSTAQYRPHPLVEGKLTAGKVRIVAYCLYGFSSLVGIYLSATRGWALLWIGLIGTFASLTYTAPPLKYKYSALGEFSVFLMWGPLMVAGAYFVQRQMFSINAFWISLPFGALVALVLLANNIRDINHDRNKGILTLAIVLGQRYGLILYLFLVVLAYLGIVLMSIFGPLYLWSLIVLLSIPLALRLLRQMLKQVPADADARTAQLDTAFGLLLVISLVLEGVL